MAPAASTNANLRTLDVGAFLTTEKLADGSVQFYWRFSHEGYAPRTDRALRPRLAAHGIGREIRGHLQSHGLTGVQYRRYDGHDYLPEKRKALDVLLAALEPPKRRARNS